MLVDDEAEEVTDRRDDDGISGEDLPYASAWRCRTTKIKSRLELLMAYRTCASCR